MQFSTIITALIAAASVTLAVPAYDFERRQTANLCTGTTSNAECCATDVLGLADLDCAAPPTLPANITDFIDICASIGQRARCCALPVLGQALICSSPV